MSTTDAKAAAAKARADLADTLDGIEDRLNVPKRAKELSEKAMDSYRENPIPWIVGAAAIAVTAIGLIAWAIFSDDD
jgi:ElaB/YqjD/DUF883 family membrane-anchored ribosome-binding protein